MKLNKNLFFDQKKCPICEEKDFINLGNVDGVHSDLLNLCDLLKCKNCKHFFLSKMPQENYLKDLYNSHSKYLFKKPHIEILKKKDFMKNKLKKENFQPNHWIFKNMKNDKKGNYLEIGPGECSLLKTFRNHGWHAEGYELQKRIQIEGVVHDIKKISKKNKNVLVFHDILEHVVDPVSFLKKFSGQQSKGDKLFLAYPNSSSFNARILKGKWRMVAPLSHLNFFSISSTKILLERCGYKPLIIKETSFVYIKKLVRSILRLPITFTLDLFSLKFSQAFKRFPEILFNILDLLKGDQMLVIAIKK